MQRLLTGKFIQKVCPPPSGRLEFTDVRTPGLAFRVTPKGAKRWSYRYRVSGRLARADIGKYPDVSLKDARAKAQTMAVAVRDGGHPSQVKRQERMGAQSFAALAERFMTEHSRRKKRSHAVDDRNLRKHVLPKWQHRPFSSIRRRDVIELLEALVTAQKPTLANRVQSLISSIFTFAMDADLVEANPSHRLRKRGRENVGTRVLSDDEIRLFWHGIVEPARAKPVGLALRLALLTGARVGEVAGICRAELRNLETPGNAAWEIPSARTKNGKSHFIPLSASAREIVLELLSRIERGDQYLLPTRAVRRKGPVRGNTLTQAMAYFCGRIEGDDDATRTWRADAPTPHDLRRTVGTRLAELGVTKEIRDRCLNHIPADVGAKHYTAHDFHPEKRAAFDRWAIALSGILGDKAAPVIDFATVRRQGR